MLKHANWVKGLNAQLAPYSPPSQGGVAAPSSKCCEASEAAQTGRLISLMSAKRSLDGVRSASCSVAARL